MREFKIGQYVYYVPRRAEGRYVVMRLLPRGTKGGPHYVIRSQEDPEREYTVEASELRKVPGAAMKNQSPRPGAKWGLASHAQCPT